MPFHKGEIIFAEFEIPNTGQWVKHPGVIISCNEVYNHDKCYICAMMTSNNQNDRFSFHLNNAMLDKPGNTLHSQVRVHLITYILEKHIYQSDPSNKLKDQAFERLIAHINDAVFDV